ncbi:metal-dependent hydrolase [Halosimplex halophilum]|uniref:metal-dependent hydrolase n=1 Tax=Halosimplex halophilum TaxID=2559572 RepID=UPI00107F87FE|nr:metal-dependent hydrolase [Halosimplex halophilum]
MWPWGHLALAYLAYSCYSRLGRGHRPTAATALVVAVASQFPDLVDKPLAWTLSVLPSGRSLAHSLLVLGPLVALLYTAARARDEGEAPLAVAFGIGAVVHAFGDALYSLVALEVRGAGFLLWPVVPPLEYEVEQSFAAHLALIDASPELYFELLVVAAAAAVWRADGYPGLGTVLAWPARAWRSVTGAE